MQEILIKQEYEKVENVGSYKGNEDNKRIYNFLKRVLDIVCSLLGLLLLSPFFLIIAILVRLDSKGPIFFSHSRIGKDGNLIKIFKFRTMVQNAEEILKNLPEDKKREFEVNFKFDDDPRITKIGKILRETSLDELPQLVNILQGDLTIVGPRPIVTKELEKYGEYAQKLLTVKPGLTGYWQVNGRSDTTYDERVQLDMEYIDKRNLRLDLIIIIKTFTTVFKKSGAR